MADSEYVENDNTNDYADELLVEDDDKFVNEEEDADIIPEEDDAEEEAEEVTEEETDIEDAEDEENEESEVEDTKTDIASIKSKQKNIEGVKPKNVFQHRINDQVDTVPFVTDYERAGIKMALVGLISADPDFCRSATLAEKNSLSPIALMEKEYEANRNGLPFTVHRIMMGGNYESRHVSSLNDYQ